VHDGMLTVSRFDFGKRLAARVQHCPLRATLVISIATIRLPPKKFLMKLRRLNIENLNVATILAASSQKSANIE